MVDTDDTRRTTDDEHWTPATPQVWHKLPTGELKKQIIHTSNKNCVHSHIKC